MDLQELVRRAVSAELERMKEAGRLSADGVHASDGAGFAAPKPCVMVLSGRNADLAAFLRQDLDPGTDILFSGDESGGRTPQRLILPSLACRDMADLALGRASGALMAEVLDLLLAGREVEVLDFAYRACAGTAPEALYELYQSYEATLASYGLRAFRKKRPEALHLRQTLLTESDVRRAGEEGALSLVIPSSALVTPLAADAAGELGIAIRKRA